LDGGSVGYSFIRVNSLIGFFSVEEIFNELSYFGDSGGSSNEYDFVDIGFFQLGII